MTPDQMRTVIDFEASLKPGDTGIACWTWSYGTYATRAEVVRVNQKSIRVRLLDGSTYLPEGHETTVPRLTDFQRWSGSNRFAPAA